MKTARKEEADIVLPASVARTLARLVAPFVAAELASMGTPDEFTSEARPSGVRTRRTFNEHARTIPGAYKVGHVWHVSRVAWFAARSKTAAARPPVSGTQLVPDVDEMLAGAGLRSTKRSA